MKRVNILTRDQIEKINTTAIEFPETSQFEIWEKDGSGIGTAMFIKFNHGILPISIDITDVSNW
jgi:hypothetical protein